MYDISPPLTPQLAVFPGDPPLSREVLLDPVRGDPVTLSALRATCHLGAHADAPSHIDPAAPSIDACDLTLYLGPCQVMRVAVSPGHAIRPEMLTDSIQAPRLLIATGTNPDPNRFNEDYAALDPETVDWLYQQGVRLVGIDTPSVDLLSARGLPSHHACLRHGIAILEGLVLTQVPEGVYELIALPLRLIGFDGSPVRAVLRPLV